MKKIIVIVILALLALSCTREKAAPTEEAKPETAKKTLATVNNAAINEEDVKKEFNMLSFRAQQLFMTEGGLESLLEELIKKEILYQEAAKRSYEADSKFEELMDDYRKRLLIGFLLKEEVEDKSDVSDSEVRKYYDENSKDFVLEAPDTGKPEVLDFESVKELIRQRLSEQKQDKVFENYIDGLKKSYNVHIDELAVRHAFGNIAATEEAEP